MGDLCYSVYTALHVMEEKQDTDAISSTMNTSGCVQNNSSVDEAPKCRFFYMNAQPNHFLEFI